MAARRERERRRPSGDRRYQFGTPETALEADADNTVVESDDEATGTLEAAPTGRASRSASRTAVATPQRGAARLAPKPFSAYREEYAYVYSDLRRVGAVIGGLLVVLIVLYFLLPLLVH